MQYAEKTFPHEAASTFSEVNGRGGENSSDQCPNGEFLCDPEKMDAVGQLAGAIAHQFNNILATVVLNAELLEQRLGKDNERVRAVLRMAKRGEKVTRQMAVLSRQQHLSPRLLDLGKLVTRMADRLAAALGNAIQANIRQVPDLWPINVDPALLTSAILNLAANARDAMPFGGEVVIAMANVVLRPKQAERQSNLVAGNYVVLSVSDTGLGIPPLIVDRVFEPFFTTKDAGEGAGLGLFQVYGFARRSGGFVAIESELGRGTTVKLYLPSAGDEVPGSTLESGTERC